MPTPTQPPSDNRFYKPETLFKAFGITSLVMMVFTLWMILDDFGREWKGYQKDFFALRQKKYDEWITSEKGKVDASQIKAAEAKLSEANRKLLGQQGEIAKLEKELVSIKTKENLTTIDFRNAKALWDVHKYEYEAAYGHYIAEGKPAKSGAEKTFKALEKEASQVEKLRDVMNRFVQARQGVEKQIALFYREKKATEKEVGQVRGNLDKLASAKEATELTLVKVLRNAPIVDMANPILRVSQIVLPTIRDDIYFAQVQTVDRCTTCHMAIDTPGYESEPQPFRTHSRLDLILGSRSPHPIDKIGCTVCHSGRGQAVDFVRTAHTPRNPEHRKVWEKKYGWHEMHHVIEKMVPLQYTEGKCRSCHKQTEFVPKAEKLTSAVQMIRGAGCYGCHKIEGWEHLRKSAPSLQKVKGKLTRDWMVKWIRNPRSFNPFARMPAAFHQSNIVSEEHRMFQEAEIHAIVDYLLAESEIYRPNVSFALGSAERGKATFGSVGCLGCHQVDDFGQTRGRFGMAPDLSTVGTKVTRDWLLSWLKNPRHYWSQTTMPSLRLSEGEISDVAAYLMSKKNPDFEKLEAGTAELETQKKVLRLYLVRDPLLSPATNEKVDGVIAKMNPKEVSYGLGKNAIMRVGCFGCHDIKGFENVQGIGTELTEEGSKPLNKLDFGLLHLEHTNVAWFQKKLEDPRIFDKGMVKEYLDLLRMPNFEFNEEEREALILAILGMTSQKIDPPSAKKMAAHEVKAEGAHRIIHQYNCQGCHVVEGIHSPLPDDHPNFADHEQKKYNTEGRVLTHFSEDETLGPPPLVTQGARVKTPWLYNFLKDPGKSKLRDKLQIRMPNFQMSHPELNALVGGWAEEGQVDYPILSEEPVPLTQKEELDARALFNKLQCMSCHTVARRATVEEMEGGSRGLAPDLALAGQRLHKNWIVQLLKDPQKMIPGTRMPGFWPEGVSPAPEILGGDSEKQIGVLARYLLTLGGKPKAAEGNAATPVAFVRKPKRGRS